ncbi:MAG: Gmad2 immunoglobulin-like domain-containing protein [Patescibacteria group bacterium]
MNTQARSIVGLFILVLVVVGVSVLVDKAPDDTATVDTTPQVGELITISAPRPGDTVSSPIHLSGQARGYWYFEASFPVELLDSTGKQLAIVPAQAQGEWMTDAFVPFMADISYELSADTDGVLVFKKDNPSGLAEHDAEVRVPVKLKATKKAETPVVGGVQFANRKAGAYDGCVISGCSAQVCGDTQVASTCEYREAYACYRSAVCERSSVGSCGWRADAALNQCLLSAE